MVSAHLGWWALVEVLLNTWDVTSASIFIFLSQFPCDGALTIWYPGDGMLVGEVFTGWYEI